MTSIAESRARADQWLSLGRWMIETPPEGERSDTLLAIGHLLAERGWNNDAIWEVLSRIGRKWGKFDQGKPWQEAQRIMWMIRNIRRHIPSKGGS